MAGFWIKRNAGPGPRHARCLACSGLRPVRAVALVERLRFDGQNLGGQHGL